MNTLKSLISIWETIANDLGANAKTIDTFSKRVNGAGLPFLTVDLPGLGKDLDRSLTSDQLIVTARFKTAPNVAYPVFLSELFSQIFTKDGWLKQDADPKTIRNLRQLLMIFYKFEVPINPADMQEGFEKFQMLDSTVKTDEWHWSLPIVRKYFQTLFPDDPKDIRCHHSSGQTADRVSNSQKRRKRRLIPSLQSYYSFEYFFQGINHYRTWLRSNEHDTAEPNSRIAFVPKDSRGPRIICMEPHERMFVQKGLQAKLYEFTETVSPAMGYINFTDQSINQRLAQKASYDRRFATIDLKDASDMVSWELIKQLLRDSPEWLDALTASRSATVEYEDTEVQLKKFAPMGSALCFPIEAFLFWAIVRPLTKEVWVYGDDLIVPTKLVGAVMSRLESYGLIVNRDKSLFKGSFRESCGGEYFHGHDVTYVRIKSLNPINFIASCNLIATRYGHKCSDRLVSQYEQSSGKPFFRAPISLAGCPRPLVYYTDGLAASGVFFQRRWNPGHQQFEIRVPTVRNRSRHDKNLSDEDLLFDWLTSSMSSTSPLDFYQNREDVHEFGNLPHRGMPKSWEILERENHSWSENTRVKFSWLPEWVVANITEV